MTRQPAPLGASNDTSRTCSRLLGYADDGTEVLCGKPAVRHIIYRWDDPESQGEAGYDHGFACGEHWADFQVRWSCAGAHELDGICGMPGSRVHPSRCYFDDLPTAEPVRAIAEAVVLGTQSPGPQAHSPKRVVADPSPGSGR